MYNRSGIRASRPRNTEFRSVFVTNWHFSVKPKANAFGFWAKILNFLRPTKSYIQDHYVYPIWNMGVTTKKYRVSVSFCHKLRFSVKPKASLWILWRYLKFFKPGKNLYTGPLCITDPEYGYHDQEMRSFGQFLPQTGVFGKTEG